MASPTTLTLCGYVLVVLVCLCCLHICSNEPRMICEPPAAPHTACRQNGTRSHPIFGLICDAQAAWSRTYHTQSTTLSQAVREYIQRYGRRPPKGFDKWFVWAQQHDVKLVDEYDLIWEQLEPFYGLSAAELRRRHQLLSQYNEAARVGVKNRRTWRGKHDWGHHAAILQKHLSKVAHLLEDADILLNLYDEPKLLAHPLQRAEYVGAARRGGLIDDAWDSAAFDKISSRAGCDMSSPTWNVALVEQESSFLGTDMRKNLDVCSQPELFQQHGLLLDVEHPLTPWCRGYDSSQDCLNRPLPYTPLFSGSTTSVSSDINLPALDSHTSSIRRDRIPFKQKSEQRAFFRGTLSGQQNVPGIPWQHAQRPRLHMLAHERAKDLQRLVHIARADDDMEEKQLSSSLLNARLLDIGLVGGAAQCWDACKEVDRWLEDWPTKGRTSVSKESQYRYAIDVDGNGWSGRFLRLMSSNSMVIKSGVVTESWRDHIQPWVHFVPMRVDYRDIYDILLFFEGDGAVEHSDLAEEIAMNGKRWVQCHQRDVDKTAYIFRAFLEIARLQSDDREAMSLDLTGL